MTTSDERLSLPSASSMERYFACAGCRALEKAVETQAVKPVEKDSAAASKGTLLHDANETGDVSDLEMSDADAVKKIRESEESLARQWCSDYSLDFEKITIIREKRFFFDFPNGRSCTAKIDTLILSDQEFLACFDTKTGRLKVTVPAANWQLRVCALLAAAEYGKTHARVAIVNLWGKQSPPCDLTSDDLIAIQKRVEHRLDLIEQPGQPRTAGDHCKWCSAQNSCPEARENLGLVIQNRMLVWDKIDPQKKIALWKMSKLGEQTCKAIQSCVKTDLANDIEIPGLAKRKDTDTRNVSDPVAAYNAMASVASGLTPAEFISKCKISLSDLASFFPSVTEAEKFIASGDGVFISKTPRSGSVYETKD